MKIKFICLNLWLGGFLYDAILDFLSKEKPDVIAMQEVFNSSLKVLKAELGYKYASFAPAFLEKTKDWQVEWGNAVLSKFPIITTKTTFYDIPYGKNYVPKIKSASRTPRNLQQAVLKADNLKLNIFNTQGIWGTDGRDNKRRLKMGQTIVNEIRGKKNVILAGDFNLSPDTKTVAKIEKHLKNVFKNELTTTFNMKRKTKPGYARAVADMIFVSKEIKVIEHYCPKVDVSDHLPLVCQLEI